MEKYNDAPDGYKWPEVFDFWEGVVWSFVILGLLEGIGYVSVSMFIPCSKGKGNPQEVKLRTTKSGATFSKFLFMVATTVHGYSIFKDAYYFPSYLGGSGYYGKLFKG